MIPAYDGSNEAKRVIGPNGEIGAANRATEATEEIGAAETNGEYEA